MAELIDLKKVREIVNDYVKLTIGEIRESEPRITFAVRDNLLGTFKHEIWRITIEYTPKKEDELFAWRKTAVITIHAETGEVLSFEEGKYWIM